LADLIGLDWVYHGNRVRIGGNRGLTALTGLDNLASVGDGDLEILYNTILSECLAQDFAAGIDVAGEITIYANGPCE
jgi:hypothetical protein